MCKVSNKFEIQEFSSLELYIKCFDTIFELLVVRENRYMYIYNNKLRISYEFTKQNNKLR